jgi:RNA polymerase sigma-70 factor, ECF subfamily
VKDARSFLLKVTSRLAIDRLRQAQAQRAAYAGPWLPEPMPTSPDAAEGVEQAESLSMAMMVVLETLSPLERAVFVMREAFGFGYGEIAETLGRSESAIRQLAHRARDHVTDRRPRFTADKATLRKVTARFMHACMGGDMSALLEILSPSVEFVTDTGGLGRAPRRVIVGQDKTARFLTSTWQKAGVRTQDARLADLNGGTGIIVTSDGAPLYAVVLDFADGAVQKVYMVANPGKLTHLSQGGPDMPLPAGTVT